MNAHPTELFLAFALASSGVVHLLPAVGVLSAQRLHGLYGVNAHDAVTLLLLRHRAVLFGILGVAFLAAAFLPAWRVGAGGVALFSMLSFVALAKDGVAVPSIRRIVRIDVVLSAMLGVALLLRLFVHG
ncbi:hypothetical protein DFR24_3746 [Panacagrimonas perspica]|uniref:Phosphopantetheine adenylyltransferase n=1 Tax=Panacagrimonas perspica TaxID=381431 RepID=A0A4S3K791_9GAMM|nr:phosphopantetheine adenylyltransferase [Panacagrimonas perspica]TDU26716.1 hypothetical protein DFR24_3746 [Panacagrimonas perspica]THD04060.1 hypothetical protein B1810_07345 [Panacagrimonas perspica]